MKKTIWAAFVMLFIVAGCSTSKITSSWKADDVVAKRYGKILVLGLIHDNDRSLQESMENHLVDDIRNLGYNAVSSLQEFGPKAFDKMDEEAALAKIRNNGVEAVVTIVLLDKEKERRYVPGNVYYSPYGYYQNRFWRYRTTLYYRIYEPGYYVTDTRYFWESNFYEMANQKLVYSVQTQSFEPTNTERLAHEYGELIVKDIVKAGVLEKLGTAPVKAF